MKQGYDETQAGKRIDNIPDSGTLTGKWQIDEYGCCWWGYQKDAPDKGTKFITAWIVGEYPDNI